MYQPRQEVFYLWDHDKKITFENVQSKDKQNAFIQAGKGAISFGISNSNMWFKVAVKNNIPDIQQHWILELAYPHYDSISFYAQDQSGLWQEQLTGDRTPFNTRPIPNKHFAFPITLNDTTTHTYYFHIGGEGSRQFPLFIQSESKFYAVQEEISMIYGGIFFGIIIIMLLYNLFIYFSLKDRVYLYYVLANTFILLFYLGYSGYGFQYLWGAYPSVNAKIIPLGVTLAGSMTIVFVRNFLEAKKYSPLINTLFMAMLLAYFIEFLCLFFFNYEIILKGASLLAMLSSVLILFSSASIWIKGNKSARFIVFAFSFYLIGILLLNLNIGGILNRNFFVAHSMEVGTAIEITLLSLALSDKYSRLRKEKEEAQAELIEMQRVTNEELEQRIQRRTQTINQQKLELQESNKVKDKLLSILSHDLKGPLNSFQTLLNMMLKDELTKENINMYTSHLNNKLGLMINLVDNILNWVRSQMEGINFDIQEISVNELVKENVHLFSSQAELKKIEVFDQVEENTLVLGDKNVVRMVIRNLLANALKFTHSGGQIFISSQKVGDNMAIEVRDTGVGIDPDKIKLLFTDAHFTSPDTNQNAGTGIGLLLCKEFLVHISGTIIVESTLGEGARFTFTLPSIEHK